MYNIYMYIFGMLHGMWYFASLNRDQTSAPCNGSTVLMTELQGKSPLSAESGNLAIRVLSVDAASAILGIEHIMGIPASQGFLLIFLPEKREVSNERLKFFFGIMSILSCKPIFGPFFLVPLLCSFYF